MTEPKPWRTWSVRYYPEEHRLPFAIGAELSSGEEVDVIELAALKVLVAALKDVFALIDEGKLVRDISKDHETDFAIHSMRFVSRLKIAHDALARLPKEWIDGI